MALSKQDRIKAPIRSSAVNLDAVLRELRARLPEVNGSAIADKSGLPIASDLPPTTNALIVAAMSAFAMQSYATIVSNLGLKPVESVTAECRDSLIIVRSLLAGDASLFVFLTGSFDSSMVKREIERAACEVERILGS